jgi:hypothetical protein
MSEGNNKPVFCNCQVVYSQKNYSQYRHPPHANGGMKQYEKS